MSRGCQHTCKKLHPTKKNEVVLLSLVKQICPFIASLNLSAPRKERKKEEEENPPPPHHPATPDTLVGHQKASPAI